MASPDVKVSKKRRHDGDTEAAKRKQKKQKKADNEDLEADQEPALTESPKPKKDKKKKSKKDKTEDASEGVDARRLTPPPTADEAKPKKSKKKHVEVDEAEEPAAHHHKKRKDKSRDTQATTPPPTHQSAQERLATDSPEAKRTPKTKTHKPSAPPPPVVMQTVARWVPLWPRGWNEPITAAIEQHFTPKLHRYDSEVGGVLLGYKDVCLNDRPTRKGAATNDHEAVKLLSVNEFGVGFVWLIAELELFLPKRGSWMEGELILQNEGHVGVVCWDKFNASIEANRLPPKWSWVAAPEDDFANDNYNMDVDGDQDGDQEASATPLGHWVDENGVKVEGKLRFRIKNYDVGLSGDHTFLCIEGTMLDEVEENRLREKELKQASGARGAIRRRPQRVLPEFSMTDLGLDEEEERGKRWRKPEKEEVAEESGEGYAEGGDEDADNEPEEQVYEEAEAAMVEEEEDD